MVSNVMFSHAKNDWKTPPELFNSLNKIFNFSLDCAAQEYNALLPRYRSPESPVEWSAEGETALWLNPPFSPTNLCRQLIEDVLDQSNEHNVPSCILLPARPDTKLWQEVILPRCIVLFLKGRLKFVGAASSAPFPSALCFGYTALANMPSEKLIELQSLAPDIGTFSMAADLIGEDE